MCTVNTTRQLEENKEFAVFLLASLLKKFLQKSLQQTSPRKAELE